MGRISRHNYSPTHDDVVAVVVIVVVVVVGGSFRQFLWQVAQELESSLLSLLILSPSSAGHKKRGRYILKPGPMTYSEEKMLQFFGQVSYSVPPAGVTVTHLLLPLPVVTFAERGVTHIGKQ